MGRNVGEDEKECHLGVVLELQEEAIQVVLRLLDFQDRRPNRTVDPLDSSKFRSHSSRSSS